MELTTKEHIHDLYYNQGYPRTAITREFGYGKSLVAYHLNDTTKAKAMDYQQQRRIRIRAYIAAYKKGKTCTRCPEDHPACLDFHHRDPSKKSFNLSTDVYSKKMSLDKIQAEIEKCDLLCANCHRKLHWDERTGTLR